MRTLQEKYNAIQEGKFSKDQFLVEARMQHPNLVTRFNGYKDAVQILKNRGMISETVKGLDEFSPHGSIAFPQSKKENPREVSPDSLTVGDIIYIQGLSGDNVKVSKVGKGKLFVTINGKEKEVDTEKYKSIELKKKAVNEARLTKNSLTDYRYKPTNEMDKYPYEQILRGLRVELEVMQVFGTPTADEYKKALAKVLKNLEKDEIFYTNQLAGNNKKVDLHDKMVDVTAKNTVDTFNGMKKATLKEGIKNLIKKALMEGSSKVEEKITEIIHAFEKRFGEISESTREEFREAILYDYEENPKGILKMSMQDAVEIFDSSGLQLKEDEEDSEDIYEMQGPKSDDEYKSELADYLEDNQIYGYTNKIHNIMTGPDEDEAYRELAEYLDSEGIYGYTRAIERIYADYPYDQHWMNQEDEDESLEEIGMFHDPVGYRKSEPEPETYTKKFVKATDKKGVYVYDIFKNGKLVKTIEGGEGDANAWMNNASKEEDLFESVSLKDLLD